MTRFGVLFYDDFEELDAVGPWEVFAASSMVRHLAGHDPDEVLAIAQRAEPVRASKGLRIVPDYVFYEHPPLDVVVVPGGMGFREESSNEELLTWLRSVANTADRITSVCTGSYILHSSGIAEGRQLATHWGFEDELAEQGATVVRDQRWVVDGNVISSQGVSAGIDMALWLIGEMYGEDHARTTQRYIQYEPAPPYA